MSMTVPADAAVPRGVCAFPVTPADASGRVDVATLRVLAARLRDGGVDSIGLLGSTGTYLFLSRAERRRALDAVLDEVGGRMPVVVGIGALRTDAAVALARDARDAGAAAGLLAPVSYTPLLADEVFEHVVAVADGGGLPLCLYDNPQTTRFCFEPELVGRLSRVPGVVALKTPAPAADAVAERLRALRTAAVPGFAVGVSVDWHAVEALIAGADCWFGVAAGLLPRTGAALVRAVRAGDVAEARRLDGALEPLWALFRAHSSLRVVHAGMEALELGRAEPPRPILPLPEEVRRRVAAVLRELEATV